MDDLNFLYGSAGVPPRHHHDHPGGTVSHDDRCIAPTRSFLQDLGDFAQFYGSGAAPANHHDAYAPHDDSCLIGSGCIGLGLDSGLNAKGAPGGLLPASGVDLFALHPMLQQPIPTPANFPDTQVADITSRFPSKGITPSQTLLDAASVSLLSQASASQSPEKRHQDILSREDVGSEADACSSCDSQCPGSEGACSEGACSLGTCPPCGPCDELTACRDENCQKDVIAPDVAHSAFILQGMTGARPQPPENQDFDHDGLNFQQSLIDPDMGFFHDGQVQPYEQAYHNVYHDSFHHDGTFEQFVQSQQTSRQVLTPRASSHNFSGGLDGQFSFASHDQGLEEDMFNLAQAMEVTSQEPHFPLDLPMSTQFSYGNAPGEAHARQTSTTNESLDTSSDLPGSLINNIHAMGTAYMPSVVMDGPSSPSPDLSDTAMNEQTVETMYLPGLLIDGVTTDKLCFPGNGPTHTYSQSQPTGLRESNPSQECGGADKFPSPPMSDPSFSEVHVDDSTQILEKKTPKDPTVHMCQWICGNEEACGQQFTNAKLLWDHVVECHVDALEKTQHGYICGWKGCDRHHRIGDASKIGFQQKSKIKRHMETHTGSAQDYICHICGMHLSAQQALDNHMLRHGDLKPHKCPYPDCQYSCRSTTGLTTHIRSQHTKDRRFRCNKCGKTFSDSSNLSKHKRSHSNGRAYVCPKCGSGFNRRDGLCRHAKAVHEMTDDDLLVLCPPNPRGGRPRGASR